MLKRSFLYLALLFIICISATAQTITHDQLMSHVNILASDKFEGRGPGTAGIDSAAAYVENIFKKNDLLPGGDNDSYFQKMDITIGVESEPTSVLLNNSEMTGWEYKEEDEHIKVKLPAGEGIIIIE